MLYSSVWTKTLLYSLRYVKSVCGQVDKAINYRAGIITGMDCGCSGEFDSTILQAEKVIALTERKKKALRLFLICRETMNGLFKPYKKALALRYWQRKPDGEIAAVFSCSQRTLFRYIREGISAITSLRKKYGWSDGYLEEYFGNEKWIMRQKFRAEDEEEAISKIIRVKKMKRQKAA